MRAIIRKTYFYDIGEAGVEYITDWDDFAQYHIQDEEVAIEVAERILADGESRNFDMSMSEVEHTIEVYDTTDAAGLRLAVEEAKVSA